MERMSPLDSWFLHVEDDADHMHIGSVGVFEGPPPPWSELRDAIGAKLDLIPRYRQRIQRVPLRLARPVWVDDQHFQLDYHVRHTALPSPGGVEQLHLLVGRVMSQQLDRNRPLWETWFVEGLEGERWAMLSKVHHCVVDGIAGTDLLALILEEEPDALTAEPSRWQAATPPARRTLVRDALGELVTQPVGVARGAVGAVRQPGHLAAQLAAAARGAAELAGVLQPMPPSSLVGPIGPHRRYASAHASLADVKAIRKALGGTVNDVILAAVTNGYREVLLGRSELHDGTEVRSMIPVSLRSEDQRGEVNNRVTALFASLPVTIADPVERLVAVRAEMDALKGSGEAIAVATMVGATGMAPAMVVGLTLRSVTELIQRRGQRFVTTVTTNVPGPQQPRYLLGHRLLTASPYVPIGEGFRTGVAIFSYDGKLAFGVTADLDSTPDADVLAAGIEKGIAELLERV